MRVLPAHKKRSDLADHDFTAMAPDCLWFGDCTAALLGRKLPKPGPLDGSGRRG